MGIGGTQNNKTPVLGEQQHFESWESCNLPREADWGKAKILLSGNLHCLALHPQSGNELHYDLKPKHCRNSHTGWCSGSTEIVHWGTRSHSEASRFVFIYLACGRGVCLSKSIAFIALEVQIQNNIPALAEKLGDKREIALNFCQREGDSWLGDLYCLWPFEALQPQLPAVPQKCGNPTTVWEPPKRKKNWCWASGKLLRDKPWPEKGMCQGLSAARETNWSSEEWQLLKPVTVPLLGKLPNWGSSGPASLHPVVFPGSPPGSSSSAPSHLPSRTREGRKTLTRYDKRNAGASLQQRFGAAGEAFKGFFSSCALLS